MPANYGAERFASLPFYPAAPTAPGTNSAADLTRLMVEQIRRTKPKSGADALRELRAAFPDIPLALRVAAVGITMGRGRA